MLIRRRTNLFWDYVRKIDKSRAVQILDNLKDSGYRLPAGTILAIGDNQKTSYNMRDFKPFDITHVKGKVVANI